MLQQALLNDLRGKVMEAWSHYVPHPFPFYEVVLGFMWVVYAWETYLSYRQRRQIYTNTAPPAILAKKGIITKERHASTRAYNLDKSSFSMFSAFVSHVETNLIFYYTLMPMLWRWSGWCLGEVTTWLGPDTVAWIKGNAIATEVRT